MSSIANVDRAAAALSFACIAHCIALPIIGMALPFFGALAEAEWLHWVFTVLAIAASGTVIASVHSARSPKFLVPALLGIGLITSALFAQSFGFDETIPSVLGGLLIASAHLYRLFKHK